MIKSYEILTILTLVMEKLPADEDQGPFSISIPACLS